MSDKPQETDRITLEKLFFSRTDERGVISGANSIFAYVSDYAISSMLRAPHRLVRHEDMPRGVFRLMWNRLQERRPVGVYVKNRARDGTYYWVFAVISPVENGYVSVRMKPSCDLLKTVEDIYTALRKAEDNAERDPGESAQALLDALVEFGFVDYDAFMSAALSLECIARSKALRRARPAGLGRLAELSKLTKTIIEQANLVDKVFRTTDQIPYNMRLQASRIEGSDGPVSVISENHRQMSFAIEGELVRFREYAVSAQDSISKANFLTAASFLMDEMAMQFAAEPPVEGIDSERERGLLDQLARGYQASVNSGLGRVVTETSKLWRQCREMRRIVAGLEMTRIMCKIERNRVKGDPEGLDEIVSHLVSAEHSLSDALTEIEGAVQVALQVAERLADRAA